MIHVDAIKENDYIEYNKRSAMVNVMSTRSSKPERRAACFSIAPHFTAYAMHESVLPASMTSQSRRSFFSPVTSPEGHR